MICIFGFVSAVNSLVLISLMTINFIYQSLTERWHQRFENLSFVLAHVKRSDELNLSFILVLLHCNDNLVIKRNPTASVCPAYLAYFYRSFILFRV